MRPVSQTPSMETSSSSSSTFSPRRYSRFAISTADNGRRHSYDSIKAITRDRGDALLRTHALLRDDALQPAMAGPRGPKVKELVNLMQLHSVVLSRAAQKENEAMDQLDSLRTAVLASSSSSGASPVSPSNASIRSLSPTARSPASFRSSFMAPFMNTAANPSQQTSSSSSATRALEEEVAQHRRRLLRETEEALLTLGRMPL